MIVTQTEAEFLARHRPPGTSSSDRWAWAVKRAFRYCSEELKTMSVESIRQDKKDGRKAFPIGSNPAGIISQALTLLWHDETQRRANPTK